jgi:hypothetical protein
MIRTLEEIAARLWTSLENSEADEERILAALREARAQGIGEAAKVADAYARETTWAGHIGSDIRALGPPPPGSREPRCPTCAEVDGGEGVIARVTKLHDAHSEMIRQAITARAGEESCRLALEVIAEEAEERANFLVREGAPGIEALAYIHSVAEFARKHALSPGSRESGAGAMPPHPDARVTCWCGAREKDGWPEPGSLAKFCANGHAVRTLLRKDLPTASPTRWAKDAAPPTTPAPETPAPTTFDAFMQEVEAEAAADPEVVALMDTLRTYFRAARERLAAAPAKETPAAPVGGEGTGTP